jgi:cation transport regulator ChaC
MLVKLVASNMVNRGLPLKPGLNIDPIPFSHTGDCVAGGIYYCDAQDLMHWYRNLGYKHLCTVTIPDGAQTVKLDRKYRSDQVILGDPYHISEHSLWQDYDLVKLIVQQDGFALKYVKTQTDEICKLAVRQNGRALDYVQEQTEELCKLAVQQEGCALQYVKEQTEEICKLAVPQDGRALKYVKIQTEEICKLAVQQDGYALQYVQEQTEELCKLAVRQNGLALECVKEQTVSSVSWQLDRMDGLFSASKLMMLFSM